MDKKIGCQYNGLNSSAQTDVTHTHPAQQPVATVTAPGLEQQ